MQKRIILVTGAAGAMGSAIAERLCKDGFHLALWDKDEVNLDKVATRYNGARSWALDQTDEAAVRKAAKEVQEMGPVYGLVNTIGWTNGTKFIDEEANYWRKLIEINYMAALYVTHALLPGMVERQVGKIVYITSDAAKVGTGGEAVYAGAKAAEVAFAKSLARETARYNINVNCTAPGPTDSPLMRDVEAQNPEMIRRMTKMVPFRRLGTPEEQADVVAFLVSEDSRWITGQVLSVSGGLTMV